MSSNSFLLTPPFVLVFQKPSSNLQGTGTRFSGHISLYSVLVMYSYFKMFSWSNHNLYSLFLLFTFCMLSSSSCFLSPPFVLVFQSPSSNLQGTGTRFSGHISLYSILLRLLSVLNWNRSSLINFECGGRQASTSSLFYCHLNQTGAENTSIEHFHSTLSLTGSGAPPWFSWRGATPKTISSTFFFSVCYRDYS